MSVCRGCGAEIVWAVTRNAKRVPLDAKPEKRYVVGPRYETENEDDPGGYLFVRVERECAELVDTFMPHHATCPEVEQFRGGDRKADQSA